MTGITVREFNGKQIEQRTDGYIDATAMCKANGKRLNNYLRNINTKAFLDELSADARILTSELVRVVKGGKPGEQGTYVHPRVATHLAQWCSPKFAVVVSGWVLDILTTGKAEVPRAEPVDPIIMQCEMIMMTRRAQMEQERKLASVRV